MREKSIFLFLFLFFAIYSFAFSDIIYLKDGRQIKAKDTWEEGDLIKFYRYGQVIGYPKDKIDKIEKIKEKEVLSSEYKISQEKIDEICAGIESYTKTIIEGRQNGVPMRNFIDAINKTDDGPVRKMARKIIIRAYDIPRYFSESMKKQTIVDFQNKIYLECLKQFQKQ